MTDEERRQFDMEFLDEYIYFDFELHIEDFERIKDVVIETRVDDWWCSVYRSEDSPHTKLRFHKNNNSKIIPLSPKQQQSLDAIYDGVKYDLDITVDEYGVRFLYGVCEGGFIYTEDIEKFKEIVNLDAMRFVHLQGNWYGIIYTIR